MKLAQAYGEKNELARVLSTCNAGCEVLPDSDVLLRQRAEVHLRMDDVESAIADCVSPLGD